MDLIFPGRVEKRVYRERTKPKGAFPRKFGVFTEGVCPEIICWVGNFPFSPGKRFQKIKPGLGVGLGQTGVGIISLKLVGPNLDWPTFQKKRLAQLTGV